MGIIEGAEPTPVPAEGTERRVIVKVRTDDGPAGLRPPSPGRVDAVAVVTDLLAGAAGAGAGGVRTEGRSEAPPQVDPLAPETTPGGLADRFSHYAAVHVAADRAEGLVEQLKAHSVVETAYLEGGPTPPPVYPANDPLNVRQNYQDAAPVGIDARWAWGRTDGRDVGFVDIEQGWTLDHEDLKAARIGVISGASTAYHGHGTAVLGEVVGVDNPRGVVGIAPKARARVVSQYRPGSYYSTAEAIISATGAMSPGDVMLLEAQTTVWHTSGYLPVEVEDAVYAAIRAAVDSGIVVVEAGGNGSVDLDAYATAEGEHILQVGGSGYRDSGAILVGAAGAQVHSRLYFSNYGSRVDCYGWGESVTTTGDGWNSTLTTDYTDYFGGTSSASPIVAGAAVLLQSWYKARYGRVLTPAQVRSWLSSPINTPSADPAADRIGRMPNLRAIIQAILAEGAIPPAKYLEWVYILLGLVNDAPGEIVVPGKGPVPVDPGWGQVAVQRRRDLVTAVIREHSGDVIDENTADAIAQRALQGFVR